MKKPGFFRETRFLAAFPKRGTYGAAGAINSPGRGLEIGDALAQGVQRGLHAVCHV